MLKHQSHVQKATWLHVQIESLRRRAVITQAKDDQIDYRTIAPFVKISKCFESLDKATIPIT